MSKTVGANGCMGGEKVCVKVREVDRRVKVFLVNFST